MKSKPQMKVKENLKQNEIILLIHATHYDIIMRFLCAHVQ